MKVQSWEQKHSREEKQVMEQTLYNSKYFKPAGLSNKLLFNLL